MGKLSESLWRFVSSDDAAPVMEGAGQVVNWSKCDYHKVFLAWLRSQADRPIDLKLGHAELIASNARANTMKEVRQHLLDLTERAHSALEIENGS